MGVFIKTYNLSLNLGAVLGWCRLNEMGQKCLLEKSNDEAS